MGDFVQDLSYLGVTARLKRLSDVFSASIRDYYQHYRIDLEPSWHLVLLYVESVEHCSLKELAEALSYSQPAVTKLVGGMTKKNYLTIDSDTTDKRKKVISLTDKARSKMPLFKGVWESGARAVEQMLDSNPHFLDSLMLLEKAFDDHSFKLRALEINETPPTSS